MVSGPGYDPEDGRIRRFKGSGKTAQDLGFADLGWKG